MIATGGAVALLAATAALAGFSAGRLTAPPPPAPDGCGGAVTHTHTVDGRAVRWELCPPPERSPL